MTKILKLIGALLIVIVIVCGFSYLTDKANYTGWIINNEKPDRVKFPGQNSNGLTIALVKSIMKRQQCIFPVKLKGFLTILHFSLI